VAGDTTDVMEDNADEVGATVADNDSVDVIEDDSVVEDTLVNVSEGMYLMQVIFISLSISITRR
jgi:hypothetical protein